MITQKTVTLGFVTEKENLDTVSWEELGGASYISLLLMGSKDPEGTFPHWGSHLWVTQGPSLLQTSSPPL